jgi:hypothetical protein
MIFGTIIGETPSFGEAPPFPDEMLCLERSSFAQKAVVNAEHAHFNPILPATDRLERVGFSA